MDWLNRLLSFRRPRQASLAVELAHRCSASVWDRIQPRVLEMSLAEARGYIRAKTTEVLHAKADAILRGRGPLTPDARRHVLAEATEAVVHKVIAEVRRIQLNGRLRRQAA